MARRTRTMIVPILLLLMVSAVVFPVIAQGKPNGGGGPPADGCTPTTPQSPTYGSAIVDGDPDEWNAGDFFAAMYIAGDSSKEHVADAYLRYDCTGQVLYVWVNITNRTYFPGLNWSNAAWAYVDGNKGDKKYTGASGNDGTPPDFAWIGEGFDGYEDHVLGYEASFSLSPGSHSIVIHIEVGEAPTFAPNTGATTEFAKNGLCNNLTITCPGAARPEIYVKKYVSVDGVSWYDADSPPGPSAEADGTVQFKFVVTNTGNVPLTNLQLGDSEHGTGGCSLPSSLAAGGSFTCVIGPFTAIPGQQTDTATANGYYGATKVDDQDDANYVGETVTFIPEFPSVAIPLVSFLGLVFAVILLRLRK